MNEEIEKLEKKKKEIEKKITLEGKKQKQATINELIEDFTKKRIDSLNEKLFSSPNPVTDDWVDTEVNIKIPIIYSNQKILLNFRTKNKELKKRLIQRVNSNKVKTIENLIFENGFIKSDEIITRLSNCYRWGSESFSFYDSTVKAWKETTKILVENEEVNILSGYKTGFKLVASNDYTGRIFKLNYLLDAVENKTTKDALKIVQEKRIKEFLLNKGIKNSEHFKITFILNGASFFEVIKRNNEESFSIDDYDYTKDIPSEYEQAYQQLKQDVEETLFEGQKEILTYMSKNPKTYIGLIKKLANCKVENEIEFRGK